VGNRTPASLCAQCRPLSRENGAPDRLPNHVEHTAYPSEVLQPDGLPIGGAVLADQAISIDRDDT
jgi:hypothetical protein